MNMQYKRCIHILASTSFPAWKSRRGLPQRPQYLFSSYFFNAPFLPKMYFFLPIFCLPVLITPSFPK